MLDLQEIRKEIDEIDQKIVQLFQERMERTNEVAAYKIEKGRQVLDKKREEEKIAALKAMAQGDFNKLAVEELFAQIMAISRKWQYRLMADEEHQEIAPFSLSEPLDFQKKKVVFPGTEGSFSHGALVEFFPASVQAFSVPTFPEVLESVCRKEADYGVLPIENSSAGAVIEAYDLLASSQTYIVAETYLKVEHALLGLPSATLEDIRKVYSHPQGLLQCTRYLEAHRNWEPVSYGNTALAARKLTEDQDLSQGAIASRVAASLYGLKVLEAPINDNVRNTTRFFVLSKEAIYTRSAAKISICVELDHRSGTLYRILSHFIFNGLNMTKIESRPIAEKNWEYRFFIDFEGNLQDAGVQNALRGIREEANTLRILGNY